MKRFANLLMLMFVLLLCVGHVEKASAKGETWYAKLTVKAGDVGNGYIYGSTASAPTPIYGAADVELESEDLGGKNKSQTFYAWAKPARGAVFKAWTLTNASLKTNNGGVADEINVTTPNNNNGGTTEGTATATWTTYKPCTVHLHASTDGAYRLDYSYTDWNGAGAFEAYNKAEILSTGGDNQEIQLYYTDQVRLSVTSGTFQGWYKDAEFTQPLTEATESEPYTLAIPNNTTSETEMHIYPKFAAQPKLFGRVNLDFAYGNATDCGTIGITEAVDAEVDYSGNPIGKTQISLVADASTPTSQTYYLHAKPVNMEQNAFLGWFSSSIPSPDALLSTDLDYAYTFDASSTDASAPTTKNVYALFMRISTHYFEMTTEPGEAGLGMVYASQTNATKPDYTYFSNYSQVLAEEIYLAGKDANTNFYLYAKPKYGYQFEGWYSDADCTVKVSGNNPYTYAASISSTDPNNPDKAHFYAKFVPATPISVMFEYPTTEGSYNVKAIDIVVSDDGEYEWGETTVLYNSAEETANKTIQIYPTDNLNFTAIPNAGNAVKSWKIAGANVTSGSNNYTAAATSGKAYGVTFGASSPFMVGSQTYSTLDAAISNLGTNKTIIVVEDATVAAGHYTIPSGVTLLVPFDDKNTITTNHNSMALENVDRAYNAARTCYRMLTLDPGAVIDVQGSINVGANIASASGGALGCGSINTAYGRIDMKSGSKINLKNGSNLYCWGIISGMEGLVTAESGSTVHEMLQHQSNPGGSKASGWDYKAFFMNQYYFQNIETPLRINYGATEKVYAELYIQGFQNANASLIGSDGLFRVNDASSYIIKTYDPSTDRTIYDMYGNASMVSLSMYVYVTIDTKKYPMPINNNMTMRCHSNGNASTVTLTYDIDLYPSAKVIIDEGVTLLVKGKLNVYDRDEWVNQGFAHRDLKDIARASFSPTRTHNRTVAELEDAAIEVNGMMRVSGGLYTSTGKANIYSSGSGKILLEKSPSPTNAVYQYKNNTLTGILVPFTAAYLKNGNGSFVSIAGAAANTTYTYFLGEWKANLMIDGCFAVDDARHNYIAIDGGYKDVLKSSTYSEAWVSRDAESMLFVHTADNCDWLKVFAVEGTTTYLKDAEGNYYEYNSTNKYWVPATQYTISFQNHKGKTIYSCNIFPNSKPVYEGATPVHPSDDEGQYTFIGWKKDGDETIYTTAELPTLNANTTFKAQFDVTPYVASITSLGVVSRYVDFASALTAANGMTTTPTLKLLSDVTGISAAQTISKSMTLDLNGHELSGTVSEMLKVSSAITLTITDGSAEQTGVISSVGTATSGNYYTMSVAKGKVILENGTLKGKANGASVFPILINTSGTFEMLGGRITTDATGSNNHGMLVKTNNTFIKGGTIDVPGAAVYISSGYTETDKMTISGGYIKGGTIINSGNSADTRVNVTGGYFSTNASLSSLVANPYHIFDNEEDSRTIYPYTVAEGYNVTFKNGETILQEGYVKVGVMPAYTGATPTKDADAQYTYTFSGWNKEFVPVTEATTYTAQFEAHEKSQTLGDIVAGYGENVEPINIPTKATSMTVHADGVVNMSADINLSGNLVLEATATTSGEIIPSGTARLIVGGNAYFDLSLNIKARQWYAVAVPWQVNAQDGISYVKNDAETSLALGQDEDVVYYDGSVRATQGATADCIKYLEDEGDKTMYPGKMYFLFFAQNLGDVTLRFAKDANAPVLNKAVSVTEHPASNPGDNDWNGIANPTTFKAYIAAGAEHAFTYESDLQGYLPTEEDNLKDHQFIVGAPVMIQATKSEIIVASKTTTSAPLRAMAQNETLKVKVELLQGEKVRDRIFVKAESEKEDTYVLGNDLAKPGVSTRVAQMWIDRYNAKLAVNSQEMINNNANYPLVFSAPAAGEYILQAKETTETGAQVYLMYNDLLVWNLSMSDYTIDLKKGNTTGYSLRLVGPSHVTTDMQSVGKATSDVKKVLIDNKVFIIRGGKVYDAVGKTISK